MTLPFDSWKNWVDHTSTEEELYKVIRRKHREEFQHRTCNRADCPDHPETQLAITPTDRSRP